MPGGKRDFTSAIGPESRDAAVLDQDQRIRLVDEAIARGRLERIASKGDGSAPEAVGSRDLFADLQAPRNGHARASGLAWQPKARHETEPHGRLPMTDALGFEPDVAVRCRDYAIGCIGAGMIMADVQLAAYQEAGFPVVAIASRTQARAAAVAQRYGIPTVHATPEALIDDPAIEILDIAYPPDQQPALMRRAFARPHIKGNPGSEAAGARSRRGPAGCVTKRKQSGKIVSVNQNMRYDQAMRVLKQILDRGDLGRVVIATIEMRAIPHWQGFLAEFDRLTIANMGVHHLDVLRFLFGEPHEIYTAARQDPRTAFPHTDGITVSTLRFPNDVLAVSMEDVWSGPARRRIR